MGSRLQMCAMNRGLNSQVFGLIDTVIMKRNSPYAPGASGNAASEDLIQLFESMGANTGVDLERAAQTGVFLSELLQKELPGRYYKYYQGAQLRKRNTA